MSRLCGRALASARALRGALCASLAVLARRCGAAASRAAAQDLDDHGRRRPRRLPQEGPRPARDAARAAVGRAHPLAMWVDYWELTNRIGEVQQPEVDAFSARWPGTYVEDRLRNDWLLELGSAATGPTSPPSIRAFE